MKKFIPNRISSYYIDYLLAAVILVSMGLRQTFGLFFSAFEQDLNCTRTEFGLAIGIQMLFWGFFAPLFGIVADKFGGNKAVFIGFIIFGLGIYMLYSGPNTGIFFQLSLGVLSWYCIRCNSYERSLFQKLENIFQMSQDLWLQDL